MAKNKLKSLIKEYQKKSEIAETFDDRIELEELQDEIDYLLQRKSKRQFGGVFG